MAETTTSPQAAVPPADDNTPGTLVELLDRAAERYPDEVASRDDGREMGWAELADRSRATAGALVAAGIRHGDRVGVLVERDALVPVALAAVLRAGAAYVAVDPRDPTARRTEMFRRAGVRLVLTSPSLAEHVEDLDVLHLTDAACTAGGVGPDRDPAPGDAASIVFTSGSSGQPKGIILTHAGLTWLATTTSLPALGPDDVVGQISSLSFDAFHYELWRAVGSGATLVSLPHLPQMLAAGIERQLGTRKVTAMLVPTMAFNHIVEAAPSAFAGVRELGVGGDVMAVSSVRRLFDSGFAGALYNFYGPAEITTTCTGHHVQAEDLDGDDIPLGSALEGVTILLLDEDGDPVPDGTPGEAVICGPGVSPGYVGELDSADARFHTRTVEGRDTPAYRSGDVLVRDGRGRLRFVGRRDDAVKVKGHRVDVHEIERVLRSGAGVRDVVVVVDRTAVEPMLVAVVVLADGATMVDLRRTAEERLPAHLVPTSILTVERIPATDHGKRDFAEMRLLAASEKRRLADHTPPVTDTEKRMAELWSGLLRVDPVGLGDDFFRLGGNSVLLFRLGRKIRSEFDVDVSFQELLKEPTLDAYCRLVEEHAGEAT